MTRMLAKTKPGHGQVCRFSLRGCTCYLYRGSHRRQRSKFRTLLRRSARASENRAWRGIT